MLLALADAKREWRLTVVAAFVHKTEHSFCVVVAHCCDQRGDFLAVHDGLVSAFLKKPVKSFQAIPSKTKQSVSCLGDHMEAVMVHLRKRHDACHSSVRPRKNFSLRLTVIGSALSLCTNVTPKS